MPDNMDPREVTSDQAGSSIPEDLQEYFRLRMRLLKLDLVEKLSRIMTGLLFVLLLVFLLSLAFFYFSFAALGWMTEWMGNRELALVLFGLFFIFLSLGLFLYGRKWILNGFVKLFSQIILEEENDGSALP